MTHQTVYVVESGVYGQRYIDAIFTSRELAEAYIEQRVRLSYAAAVREWEAIPEPLRRGQRLKTLEEYRAADLWNGFGDISEAELWDEVPVGDTVALL